MTEIELFVAVIENLGVPIALLGYFVWRDYMRDKKDITVLENNTLAITKLSMLIKERIPKGGN